MAYHFFFFFLNRIYSLEQRVRRPDARHHHHHDLESAPLLDAPAVDDNAIFQRALDTELEKICSFYKAKEVEIYADVDQLVKDEQSYASETLGIDMEPVSETVVKARRMDSGKGQDYRINAGDRRPSTISESVDTVDSHDDIVEPSGSMSHNNGKKQDDNDNEEDENHDRFRDPGFLSLYNAGVSLKKHAVEVYVSLCELKSFVQLNRTGFSKALKKYDKILDRSLRRVYMNSTVSESYPFTGPTFGKLQGNVGIIEKVYANVVTKGNIQLARRELRLHLREHVAWERNTVWREMIGIERKAQAANVGIRNTLLAGPEDPAAAQRQGDETESQTKEVSTPLGRCRIPKWMFSSTFAMLVAILVLFTALLSLPFLKKPEQQNCMAMLVLVSLLWATEVIPLFVTSLLIPFLVVVLGIMRSEEKPHERLDAKTASGVVFASMWTSVIMLLLGGFTIAAALSKHDIARRMATFVLSKAGTNPAVVLLTNMFVSMFLSMWISNVASPVLCYSIIQVSVPVTKLYSWLTFTASSSQPIRRIEFLKGPCLGYRSGWQYRRLSITDCVSAEYNCASEHASQP